jgi:hypothetical protein
MSLYTKARKHIDMNRVKELHEEKIKRKKIVDEIREQIREELGNLNSPEFSNWREGIAEGMTSSGMFNTTLPATGDVDLVTTEQTFETSFNGNNESVSGGEVILSGSSNSIAGGEHTIYRRAMFKVDASKSSTLKLTIAKGGGTSSWTDRDPAESFNDQVKLNVYSDADPFDSPSSYNANVGSGTHLINLPKNYSDLVIQIEQFAKVSGTGTLRITGASLQRRTPMNVFVSLDSPEATSFIRTDPTMTGLSAEERKKKLMDMLDAGDEYLLKYLGLIGSSARPSDTTMPDSWEDAALKDITPQQRSEAEKIINNLSKYGDIASVDAMVGGVENTAAVIGAIVTALGIGVDAATDLYNSITSTGPEWDFNDSNEGEVEPDPVADLKSKQRSEAQETDKALQDAIDQYGEGSDEAQEARQAKNDTLTRHKKERKDLLGKKGKDDRGRGKEDNPHTSKGDTKTGGNDTWYGEQTARKGRYLSEKKKLKSVKDITSKIPGYYDGKPAPLGFPMDPPPKTINGYHPDLVTSKGQKKQSNRYNRLDPASAKAMPPTGNPHIDKKVRAAAKKPK